MDLNLLQSNAAALIAAHPLAYTAAVGGFSAIGGWMFLGRIGDAMVKRAANWESAKLAAAGLSPAQRKAVLEEQAKAMDRAADDLRAVAAAIVVQAPAEAPAAPPATPAA